MARNTTAEADPIEEIVLAIPIVIKLHDSLVVARKSKEFKWSSARILGMAAVRTVKPQRLDRMALVVPVRAIVTDWVAYPTPAIRKPDSANVDQEWVVSSATDACQVTGDCQRSARDIKDAYPAVVHSLGPSGRIASK